MTDYWSVEGYSEALEGKDCKTIMSMIVHDIRNRTSSIQTSEQLLQQYLDEDNPSSKVYISELLEIIKSHSQHIANILQSAQ
ncbi:MAG: hypothetical protein AAFQ52_07560 [Chloroflexota bacterium]